ncbi:MAG: tRNA (adenosine(37)-N6)-threonylcarbamoyltransferase complex ATPase subunit type 1 TsaE, partial [Odoribacter sp.]|nr:tRNA (adenosine(37)-N6)-threonylcarbamoyltransferase complex ATPase subunit type 1 TsaE [Odoribacter sp.]
DVSSPTFAIVNEYRTAKGEAMYHFDFYRVKDATEAMDFGYEEYFFGGGRCFIEWPEKVAELIPEETVACYFSELPDGRRELEVKGED